MSSTGPTRMCNYCRRPDSCDRGNVHPTDQFWYCHPCWRGGVAGPREPWATAPREPWAAYPVASPPPHVPIQNRGVVRRRLDEDEYSSDDESVEGRKVKRAPTKRRKDEAIEKNKQAAKATTEPTTLMLRNLPRTMTRDMLFELFCDQGLGDRLDFLYVPTNFEGDENFGYGFVNLKTFQDAENCRSQLQDFGDWPTPWDQTCKVLSGDTCQGLEALVLRYRNSPVMHESNPDGHKPAIYKDGVRQDFPPPTRPLKKPRPRQRKPKGAVGAEKAGAEAEAEEAAEQPEPAE